MSGSTILLVQSLHGLVYGFVLFLISSGLAVTMGILRITNVAHGSFYMMGAYAAVLMAAWQLGFWAALLVAPAILFAVGGVLERTLLSEHRSHFHQLLLTFCLFFIVNELVLLGFGAAALPVSTPSVLQGSIELPGFTYPVYRLFVLAVAILVSALLLVVISRTKMGAIVRAVVADPGMAEAVGINTGMTRFAAFGVGAALAGFAGVIASPIYQADPTMAATSLLNMFIVVILGGFGSLAGPLIISLLLGQLQAFGIMYIPNYFIILQLAVFIGILVIRPQGLLGEAQ